MKQVPNQENVWVTQQDCQWAISGLSSRDVGNPYIVYGICVNKLIYGMTNQTLPVNVCDDDQQLVIKTKAQIHESGITLILD